MTRFFFPKANFSEDWHSRQVASKWLSERNNQCFIKGHKEHVWPGQASCTTPSPLVHPSTPIPVWAIHQLLRLQDIWFLLKRGLFPSAAVFVTAFILVKENTLSCLCSHVMRGCSWEMGQRSWVDVEQMSDIKGKFPNHSNFTPPSHSCSLEAKALTLFLVLMHWWVFYKSIKATQASLKELTLCQVHISTHNWCLKFTTMLISSPLNFDCIWKEEMVL